MKKAYNPLVSAAIAEAMDFQRPFSWVGGERDVQAGVYLRYRQVHFQQYVMKGAV